MAQDATGTPTAKGIPKFNTAVDAPSGKGFNAAMDAIDGLLDDYISSPAGIAPGEVPVWNGSAFVRSSVTRISTVRPQDLGQDAATTGQVLTWNGSIYAPAAPVSSMTLIEKIDLSVTTAFAALPTTYDSLQIMWKARSPNAGTIDVLFVRFNGDAGNNYDYMSTISTNAPGVTAAVTSGAAQLGLGGIAFTSATANRFGTGMAHIHNYRDSAHKSVWSEYEVMAVSSSAFHHGRYSGVWKNTAAITGITLLPNGGGACSAGSAAWLYGLKGA